MGRPKGSKNKKDEVVVKAVQEEEVEVIVDKQEEDHDGMLEREEETKKAVAVEVLPALGEGQKYFEAPTGEVVVGEASANHIWWRHGNGGHGMWINHKR